MYKLNGADLANDPMLGDPPWTNTHTHDVCTHTHTHMLMRTFPQTYQARRSHTKTAWVVCIGNAVFGTLFNNQQDGTERLI